MLTVYLTWVFSLDPSPQGRHSVLRLTIIIPVYENHSEFEETLASVLQNRPHKCQIVVALAAPYDDPYSLSDEVEFALFEKATNVVALTNESLKVAQNEIVHVLQVGMKVTDGWTEAALELFADPMVGMVTPLSGPSNRVILGTRWTIGGIRKEIRSKSSSRKMPTVDAPSLAAGFYRRSWLEAAGGIVQTVPITLADIETGLRLRQIGARIEIARDSRVFGNWAPPREGGFAKGRALEQMIRRHAPGRSFGKRLARLFGRGWSVLGEHGISAKLAHIAGRGVGALELGIARRHQRWLNRAQAFPSSVPISESERIPLDVSPTTNAEERRAA